MGYLWSTCNALFISTELIVIFILINNTNSFLNTFYPYVILTAVVLFISASYLFIKLIRVRDY